jgi:hypothetical protein
MARRHTLRGQQSAICRPTLLGGGWEGRYRQPDLPLRRRQTRDHLHGGATAKAFLRFAQVTVCGPQSHDQACFRQATLKTPA